jgi:hypothetical protein
MKPEVGDRKVILLIMTTLIIRSVFDSILGEIISLIVSLIVIVYLFPKAIKNINELRNRKIKNPRFMAGQSHWSLIILGIFFLVVGTFNIFYPFLGISKGAVFPDSFQYSFSAVIVILGLLSVFRGFLIFDAFRLYVQNNYWKLRVFIFCLYLLFALAILLSIILSVLV